MATFSQEKMYPNNFDSLGHRAGAWKIFTAINYINDKGRYNGLEGYEYGRYIEGVKVGVWHVKDHNGLIIGQRVYINDTTLLEIQYKDEKIFSVVKTHLGVWKEQNQTKVRITDKMEITSFNKRGKIRSVTIWGKQ